MPKGSAAIASDIFGLDSAKPRVQYSLSAHAKAQILRLASYQGYTVTTIIGNLAANAGRAILGGLPPRRKAHISTERYTVTVLNLGHGSPLSVDAKRTARPNRLIESRAGWLPIVQGPVQTARLQRNYETRHFRISGCFYFEHMRGRSGPTPPRSGRELLRKSASPRSSSACAPTRPTTLPDRR
jgi:hypothetical protein